MIGTVIADVAADLPELERPAWARLTAAGPGLWRVADQRGRQLGHLRAVAGEEAGADTWRFRAERYQGSARSFRAIGEFWAASDALDCLRYQS